MAGDSIEKKLKELKAKNEESLKLGQLKTMVYNQREAECKALYKGMIESIFKRYAKIAKENDIVYCYTSGGKSLHTHPQFLLGEHRPDHFYYLDGDNPSGIIMSLGSNDLLTPEKTRSFQIQITNIKLYQLDQESINSFQGKYKLQLREGKGWNGSRHSAYIDLYHGSDYSVQLTAELVDDVMRLFFEGHLNKKLSR